MKCIVLFFVLLGPPVFLQAQYSPNQNVEELRSQLKRGAVMKVEIVRLPDGNLMRTDLPQKSLSRMASYTVTLNQDFEALVEPALEGVSLATANSHSDLRWGLVFYDNTDRQIASLLVSRSGATGSMNGSPVSFNVNLAQRLQQLIRGLH